MQIFFLFIPMLEMIDTTDTMEQKREQKFGHKIQYTIEQLRLTLPRLIMLASKKVLKAHIRRMTLANECIDFFGNQ